MLSIDTLKNADIYIEINGKKLAMTQSFKETSLREHMYVEAFLEDAPVAVVNASKKYKITISKLQLNKNMIDDKIDLFNMHNFDLVIGKPGSRVKYTGCEWDSLIESFSLKGDIIENINIIAADRLDIS